MSERVKVPFYDTKSMPESLRADFLTQIRNAIVTDNLIDGFHCKSFEENFSKYLGSSYCVGVGNGLDAITLSLRALGVGPGDLVGVPAHTFIATWFAIQAVGATPVGIDVNHLGLMSVELLEESQGLRCVIPVHMHGRGVDMRRLTKWSNKNNVYVIEDCAQAHGLMIQGKKAGTWGDFGAFSFYPTKNLFALGDGGAVVTDSVELANTIRSISRYGADIGDKYRHRRLGFNSRLDSVQAAALILGLKWLDEWNESRAGIALQYDAQLDPNLARLGDESLSVYHHYPVLHPRRNELKTALARLDISTEVHYPYLAAREIGAESGKFPQGEYISSNTLSLPLSPWQSSDQTNFVIESINQVLNVI